jgi:hypothetical protein
MYHLLLNVPSLPSVSVQGAITIFVDMAAAALFGQWTRNIIGVSVVEHSLWDPARLVRLLQTK